MLPSSLATGINCQNTTQMRTLYWNARSINNKREEIQKISSEYDLIILAETWLNENSHFQLTQFDIHRTDRTDGHGGGLAFAIRRNLKFEILDGLINTNPLVEISGIKIMNLDTPLNFIACYRPPGYGHLSLQDWDAVMSNAHLLQNTIIVGDFNAHNVAWNCCTTDVDGTYILDCSEKYELFLHNHDSFTHIDSSTGNRSNIDLFFSTPDIAQYINIEISQDSWGSDHYPIIAKIDVNKINYERKTFKIQSKKTNWTRVNESLTNELVDFMSFNYEELSPVAKYDYFMLKITAAVTASTPPKRKIDPSKHRNPVPWWDSDCDRIKRIRQAAHKKWQFTRKEEDYMLYKKLRSDARRTFRTKKRQSFREFASTVNFTRDMTYTWNKARIFKSSWVNTKTTATQQQQPNSSNILEALDNLVGQPSPQEISDFIATDQNFDTPLDAFFDRPFTYAEFNTALYSRGDKSSPGIDGINYEILKHIPISYHLLLLDIFNSMYEKNEYPTAWKNTYVHFASKPNGNGLRPLALTPCTSKLFELMLSYRLKHYVETNDVLPDDQSGFRKGLSCADNLASYKLFVEDAFSKKQQVMAVYLDISGAFNDVKSHLLLEKLREIGFSHKVIKFVSFMVQERKIFTEANIEEPRTCYKGVPQGGVLSPLLYTLYISDITRDLPADIHTLQYADDTVIFMCTDDPEQSKIFFEENVQLVIDKLNTLNLKTSVIKTKYMLFSKEEIDLSTSHLSISGQDIQASTSAKLLGVHFDYRLSFKQHISQVIMRANKALNIIKFLRGVYWGADPSTLLRFYKSYVRPIIDYGVFIYLPTAKTTILKLERVQYSAVRLSLGLRISTPTNILLAESNLMSISQRAKLLCHSFLLKVFSKTNCHLYKQLEDKLMEFATIRKKKKNVLTEGIKNVIGIKHHIHQLPFETIYNYNAEITNTTIHVDVDTGKTISSSDYPSAFFYSLFADDDALKVYTDGSKLEDGLAVGSSYVCPELNVVKKSSINPNASIFTAEATALHQAVLFATNNNHRNVIVFTDSLSVAQALKSHNTNKHSSYLLFEILQANFEFYRTNQMATKLTICWIPAHVGIVGNELADATAKTATVLAPETLQISRTDLKALIKKAVTTDNIRAIQEDGKLKGIQYFNRIYTHSSKPWFEGHSLSRKELVFISRCRSGHVALNESLIKINLAQTAECECGHGPQNLNHVIWSCPKFNVQREDLLRKLLGIKQFPPYDILSYLQAPNVPVMLMIHRFVCDCDLKI